MQERKREFGAAGHTQAFHEAELDRSRRENARKVLN
jgi:hypothetical protein